MQELAAVLDGMGENQLEFISATAGSVVVRFMILPPNAARHAYALSSLINNTESAFWVVGASPLLSRIDPRAPLTLIDTDTGIAPLSPTARVDDTQGTLGEELDCDGDDYEHESCVKTVEGFGAENVQAILWYVVLPIIVVIAIALKVSAPMP
jgi:hypothetical protein